jgi:DNA-binding NtrC family response regulator
MFDMSHPATILVVEDNDFVRMQVVKFLADAGYNVLEAAEGGIAIDMIKAQSIDIAVIDVRMEPMDGFEMIKALHGLNIDIPVILVTGDYNPDLLSEASRWYVKAVLMKPVQKDRLLMMVSRTLQQQARRVSPASV